METTRRRPIVGVSTKMYFSLARTHDYVAAVAALLAADGDGDGDGDGVLDRADVFVLPDFVALPGVVAQLRAAAAPGVAQRFLVGAQDCAADDAGAFTGFVSPAVLAAAGARLVAVGHAERRRLLGETDATTAAKAAAAVRHGLVPLVCVGEEEAPGGAPEEAPEEEDLLAAAAAGAAAVARQVAPVLAAVGGDAARMLVAYEPVWAIGAAQPAPAAYVRAVVAGVRAALPGDAGARLRILYGGSAGPGLFAQLAGVVDGLFLGRFGHDPARFVQTAREVASGG